jgi:hypothetical protein
VIFMFALWPLCFALSLLIQTTGTSYFPPGVLSLDEKGKIEESANNLERRIKTYQTASARIQRTIHEAVSKDEFQSVPDDLRLWVALLTGSLKDIEDHLASKKKSKALKEYEIHLRKAIGTTRGYRTRAPVDQQDIFESCLTQAETTRRKFVQLLFPR